MLKTLLKLLKTVEFQGTFKHLVFKRLLKSLKKQQSVTKMKFFKTIKKS